MASAICFRALGRFVLSAQAGRGICTLMVSSVCPTTFEYLRSVLSTCAGSDTPGLVREPRPRAADMTTVAQGVFRRFVHQVDVTWWR